MATTKMTDDGLPIVKSTKRKVQVRAHLEEFGRTWDLIRPNQLVASKLVEGTKGDVNPEYITRFFAAHVHPDQRDDFIEAAMGDDTLEVEDFMDLMGRMSEAVYGELPSQPS